MWWWQAAQWNTDRYVIPRGRMHEPALDYHKPAKRGGKRERGGADSVDRGQVGFVPFTDWISRPPHALETAAKEFNPPEKGIWAMSPETIMVLLLQRTEGIPKSPAPFPLPNLILPWPHMEQNLWGSSTVRDTRNDSSEKLKMQWDSFP